MKWTAFTMDLSKIRKTAQNVRTMTKNLLILSLSTLLFFVFLGLGGYAQSYLRNSPISSMKGLAAQVSNDFFIDMIGLEIPQLNRERESTFSGENVFGFVFRLITDINPKDPKTLLAREVPGLGKMSATPIRGTSSSEPPQDYGPSPGGTDPQQGEGPQAPPPEPSPIPSPSPSPSSPPSQEAQTTQGKKVVLIYHTHYEESWVPELDITEADKAYDESMNITLVGKRLADKLEEYGVGAVDYSPEYKKTQADYSWYKSYKYSRSTVKEAFAAHPEINFVFDIHRDSLPRDKTTVTINGVDYAQVYFIIGQRNPDWQQNEQFAAGIHDKLEEKMPGLSRGIWGKSAHQGDAEYNQSLSPNSVLIEVGGPFNTLEESYRTADILAEVISEIYWNAEKVNAPAGTTSD
ncbi:stage II sporulation protein P [Paenibacillus sp. J2TS4]|uniref:stage II sporulation protein P n=1 Tax=Paenibacillus sp. J2TS4 TaxID=2807194 RepID=UPI001B2CB0B7|nr:stage II sporulation protein P [Paenibacillus sp. J2TS4]GIP35864.1 stage II sporulation protein P [Paenibacillus sp. J2TS4]